ncbi:GGDEF domain-containing protein [Desulfospira joergensenii]|uniref:GGDEF domain-containing protein n=1 Tax=Desulfospira joergensenii TaxID=53329 RepID=UPI0003B69782|nr:GGDEF domain-containing protein [Desulfospira joergensenii]
MSVMTGVNWLNALDMRTIILVALMVTYISTYIMAVTWVRIQGKFQGIGGFTGYFGLTALGLSLVLFKGQISDLITIVGVNALMFAGMVMLAGGMARFLNVFMNRSYYFLLFMVFILLYVWFAMVNPDVRIRIMIFSGSVIPIQVHLLWMIFFKAAPDQRRHAFNTGITILLFFIIFLIRLLIAFFFPEPENYLYDRMPDHLFQSLLIALIVLLSHSLQLMINSRLLNLTQCHARVQERLACQDELTTLYNRRKLNELVENEFSRFRRHGRAFSLILGDIDLFKQINDRCGHTKGDQALIRVAEILRENIRAEDTAGRWGGEEFLILLPETGLDDAVKVARKLRNIFTCQGAETRALFGQSLSLSFGVAQVEDQTDMEKVLRQADMAMYQAKEEGRNRMVAYSL